MLLIAMFNDFLEKPNTDVRDDGEDKEWVFREFIVTGRLIDKTKVMIGTEGKETLVLSTLEASEVSEVANDSDDDENELPYDSSSRPLLFNLKFFESSYDKETFSLISSFGEGQRLVARGFFIPATYQYKPQNDIYNNNYRTDNYESSGYEGFSTLLVEEINIGPELFLN